VGQNCQEVPPQTNNFEIKTTFSVTFRSECVGYCCHSHFFELGAESYGESLLLCQLNSIDVYVYEMHTYSLGEPVCISTCRLGLCFAINSCFCSPK